MSPEPDLFSTSYFFVAGGTLRPDSPSYVTRPTDDQFFAALQDGKYCYALTPRQMGKSSLMVRTARRLQAVGIRTAIIDLTAIGTELNIDQWHLGLLMRLRAQLKLHFDVQKWWGEQAGLGAVQRFTTFLHDVVLKQIETPVVILVDEIDTTINLPFSDDFFAAIRAIYNERASNPIYNRLTFAFLGVATPDDLIKDPNRTPFNIGHEINLREFTREDAVVLENGLTQVFQTQGKSIFDRIFYWTNGHPYLTQRLCLTITENDEKIWSDEAVDKLVDSMFLSDEARGETNIQFVSSKILNSPDRNALLRLYGQIRRGKTVLDNKQSVTQSQLKLSGLVKVEGNRLVVRNEIYSQAFDTTWINEQMPVNWPLAIAAAAVLVTLITIGILLNDNWWLPQQARAAEDSFLGAANISTRQAALQALFKAEPILGPSEYQSQGLGLFYGLTWTEQLAVFNADNFDNAADLTLLVQGVYSTLADIEGNEQTSALLQEMSVSLATFSEDPKATILKSEIDSWLDARANAAQGEYETALELYQEAIDTRSDNPATYFERAKVYIALDDYPNALSDLDQVVEIIAQKEDSNTTDLGESGLPEISFDVANYTVSENSASATINVAISAAPQTTATVEFLTVSALAISPGDYTSTSGTLTFSSAAPQSFTVKIIDDSQDELNETIRLVLRNPVNATLAAGADTAQLTIQDNDLTPTNPGISSVATAILNDFYEPNDSFNDAYTFEFVGLDYCNITLWPEGDVDYFRFWLKASLSYEIRTSNLDAGLDTKLIIYNSQENKLAENDDFEPGNRASLVRLSAQETGYHFAQVTNLTGSDPSGKTYCLSFDEIEGTPTPTPFPTGTPVPGADDCEENDDPEQACLIGVNTTYDFNFVPSIGKNTDVDYFRLPVRNGLLYSCETINLSSVNDTQLFIYDQDGQALAGNDEKELGDHGSRVDYLATYSGWLYLLVRPIRPPDYALSYLYTYSLYCDELDATATPTLDPITGRPTLPPITIPTFPSAATISPVPTATASPTLMPVSTPTPNLSQTVTVQATATPSKTPTPTITQIPSPQPVSPLFTNRNQIRQEVQRVIDTYPQFVAVVAKSNSTDFQNLRENGLLPVIRSILLPFNDDFSTNNSGWPALESTGAHYGYNLDAGVYQVASTAPGLTTMAFLGSYLDDITIEVETSIDSTLTADDVNYRYGLALRRTGEQFYAFAISPLLKSWYVLKGTTDGILPIEDGNYSTNGDPLSVNSLRIDADGDTFVFSINGQPVTIIIDSDYSAGDVGFYVETLESEAAEIQFDALEIRTPTLLANSLTTSTPGVETTSFVTNTPIFEDFIEPNDNFSEAFPIEADDGSWCNLTLWPENEVDYYRFWLKGGLIYEIQTENVAAALDTVLKIYSPQENMIAMNDDFEFGNRASKVILPVTDSGFYYAQISNVDGSDPANKTYCFEVSEIEGTPTPTPTSTPTRVPGVDYCEENDSFTHACLLGSNVDYDLSFVPLTGTGPDQDYFTLNVREGVEYTCETHSLSSTNDTILTLFDENENELARNDNKEPTDRGSRVNYKATYDGTVYILVEPFFTPSYVESFLYTYSLICEESGLSVTPTPTQIGALSPTSPPTGNAPVIQSLASCQLTNCGELALDSLEVGSLAAGESQHWDYDVSTATTITISVASALDINMVIEVRNPQGEIESLQNDADDGDPEILANLNLIQPGLYQIYIYTADGSPGSYAILLQNEAAYPFIFQKTLVSNQSETASLAANNDHFWHFFGQAGDIVTITVTSDNTADIFLRLFANGISIIEFQDEGANGYQEQIADFRLPETGIYSIVVAEYNYESAEYEILFVQNE